MSREQFKITTFIVVTIKFKGVKPRQAFHLSYISHHGDMLSVKYSYIIDLNEQDKVVESRQELVNTLPTDYYKDHVLHKALWVPFIDNINAKYNETFKWEDIENMYLGTSSKVEKYESTFSKIVNKITNLFSFENNTKED